MYIYYRNIRVDPIGFLFCYPISFPLCYNNHKSNYKTHKRACAIEKCYMENTEKRGFSSHITTICQVK